MNDRDFVIRRAVVADLPVLGRLGALLMRTHYEFDPLRFIAPGEDSEDGYARFLGAQLQRADAAIFVAARNGEPVGYLYAGIEPMSWRELRDRSGFVHDVVVAEPARHSGVASALLAAAIDWLADRGLPRVVLMTAWPNDVAQQLFGHHGFRRTMVEMTREIDVPDSRSR
jgi:ribosomal protein S18 acetylase RimI-like enzyme